MTPYEKRVQEWQSEITEVINYLMQNGLTIENLQKNDLFFSLVLEAANVAIKTHQKGKREALKNILINSVLKADINEDLKLKFVRLVDDISPSHTKLLFFISAQEKEISKIGSYEELYHRYKSFNETSISQDEFKLLCQELINQSLIKFSDTVKDFRDVHESSGLRLLDDQDAICPI